MTEIVIDSTTIEEGMTVPTKITIEYPDNQGFYAFALFHKYSDEIATLLAREFIARGDLSVRAELNLANTDNDADHPHRRGETRTRLGLGGEGK